MIPSYASSKDQQAQREAKQTNETTSSDPGLPTLSDYVPESRKLTEEEKQNYADQDAKRDMSYNSIDYDMAVQSNGDVALTEHVDMRLAERDFNGSALPWTNLSLAVFLSDDSSFLAYPRPELGAITDVSVSNAQTGEDYRHVPYGALSQYDKDGNQLFQPGMWTADVYDQGAEADYTPVTMKADAALSAKDEQYAANRDSVTLTWAIPPVQSAESLKFDISMTLKNALTRCGDRSYFAYRAYYEGDGHVGHVHGRLRLPEVVNKPVGLVDYSGRKTVGSKGARELDFDAYDVPGAESVAFYSMFDGPMGEVRHDMVWDGKSDKFRDKRRATGDSDKSISAELTGDWALQVFGYLELVLVFLIFGALMVVLTNRQTKWRSKLDYYHDVPDMSPASAANFINVIQPSAVNMGWLSELGTRELLSTLLSLSSKKVVELHPGSASAYEGIDLATASDEEIRAREKVALEVQDARMAAAERARANDNTAGEDSAEASGDGFGGGNGLDDNNSSDTLNGNIPNGDSNAGSTSFLHRFLAKPGRVQTWLSHMLWRTQWGWAIRRHPHLARLFGGIPKPADGRTATVRLLHAPDDGSAVVSGLRKSEAAMLTYLDDFAQWKGSRVFDLNELRNSTESWNNDMGYERHAAKLGKPNQLARPVSDPSEVWTAGIKKQQAFLDAAQEEYKALKLTRISILSMVAWIALFCLFSLGFFMLRDIWDADHQGLALGLGLPGLFLALMVFTLMQNYMLTPRGRLEAGKILGLMAYMRDFSDFSKRGVEDLAIWGQYLTYAIALGMETKVTRQLAFRLPTNPYWGD